MIVVAGWLALFGVWPVADPGHSVGDGPLVAVDLLLHVYGAVLAWRLLRHRRA